MDFKLVGPSDAGQAKSWKRVQGQATVKSIGLDDVLLLSKIPAWRATRQHASSKEYYKRIYDRFYRRVKPESYRPGRESLAVLRHLSRTGPLTVTEAAQHFSRSQASTSEVFARLEKRGLLARVVDSQDRRRTLVWLTKTGLNVLDDSSQVLSRAKLERAFQQLSDTERHSVVQCLEALLQTETHNQGWDDE